MLKTAILMLLIAFFSANTHAQLGRLLKKDKGSTEEKVETKVEDLELDLTTFRMKPAITFASLLYGTQVHTGGSTRFENYTGTFIPYVKADGSPVNTIGDQGQYLKVKVYKGEEFVDYFEYDGGQTFDNNKKRKLNGPTSRYMKNGDWASGTNVDLKKWGEGMYRLDFYAGKHLFYTFEFEVYKVTNDDPYADKNEMYLSRGPWNKYAYIQKADKTGNFVFGIYMNHEEFKPVPEDANKTSKSVEWSVKVSKGGELYATHYNVAKPKVSKVSQGKWSDYSTAMKLADGKTVLKVEDLTDGSYEIEVTLSTEDTPRVYKFDVANGKIVLMDEQDRTKNSDPTRLIEGWNDFFWLKQEGK